MILIIEKVRLDMNLTRIIEGFTTILIIQTKKVINFIEILVGWRIHTTNFLKLYVNI